METRLSSRPPDSRRDSLHPIAATRPKVPVRAVRSLRFVVDAYLSASIIYVQLEVSDVVSLKGLRVINRTLHGSTRLWLRTLVMPICMAIGLVMAALTVLLSVANAISVQQAVALALVSAVTAIAGVTGVLVPDVYTAWRRGFRLGCETTLRAHADDGSPADSDADSHPGSDADSRPGQRR